jgi:hypothetical protein
MTPFFLPAPELDRLPPERAYAALREQAEACTGSVSRERRILEIECRHRGADRQLRVGECDVTNGRMIAAILQLGRDTYTVHHVDSEPGRPTTPTVLQRNEVYSVTEFD